MNIIMRAAITALNIVYTGHLVLITGMLAAEAKHRYWDSRRPDDWPDNNRTVEQQLIDAMDEEAQAQQELHNELTQTRNES
jgi:hypothetical protein